MHYVELGHKHTNVQERNSDDELKEDQVAANRFTEISGHPYASCLQIEDIAQTVFSLMPGENTISMYILLENDFEVLVISDLFPIGHGCFNLECVRENILVLLDS